MKDQDPISVVLITITALAFLVMLMGLVALTVHANIQDECDALGRTVIVDRAYSCERLE